MNLGAQKLRLLIEPRGKQQALSELLGVDPGVVSRWAYKTADGRGTRPNAANRIRLLELVGIGLSDWEKPETETPDVTGLKFGFDQPGGAPAEPLKSAELAESPTRGAA